MFLMVVEAFLAEIAAKRLGMRIGVTYNAGAKSKIQIKCMEGGRSC